MMQDARKADVKNGDNNIQFLHSASLNNFYNLALVTLDFSLFF